MQEEIMLPGPKVGLIIGKNGKTIKQLQEQSGAKMVVIQDGPNTEYVSIILLLKHYFSHRRNIQGFYAPCHVYYV